jgi:hypothetical protein
MPRKRQCGRKDHYIPQGYLRGFVDPARESLDKPLWHFALESGEWSEKSSSKVGWARGFYAANTELEHAGKRALSVAFAASTKKLTKAHPPRMAHARGLFKRPSRGYVISPRNCDRVESWQVIAMLSRVAVRRDIDVRQRALEWVLKTPQHRVILPRRCFGFLPRRRL